MTEDDLVIHEGSEVYSEDSTMKIAYLQVIGKNNQENMQ
jgi:hypothetical protein